MGWDHEMKRPVTFCMPWEPADTAEVKYCGLVIVVRRIVVTSGMRLIPTCNDSCKQATKHECDCACGGENHGVAWLQVLTER